MQDEFFWSSWLYSIKQSDEVLYNPLPYSDVKETSEIVLTVTTCSSRSHMQLGTLVLLSNLPLHHERGRPHCLVSKKSTI